MESCGTFWQRIIARLPPYYDEPEPEFSSDGSVTLQLAAIASPGTESSLHKLLENLFPLEAFFARAIDDDADRRNNRLLGFFTAHWERLRGEYADPLTFHNGNCLNFARRYPQLREHWTREELADMDSVNMLSRLYRTDPALAITIWRSIAGTEDPLFDPRVAEDFFASWSRSGTMAARIPSCCAHWWRCSVRMMALPSSSSGVRMWTIFSLPSSKRQNSAVIRIWQRTSLNFSRGILCRRMSGRSPMKTLWRPWRSRSRKNL